MRHDSNSEWIDNKYPKELYLIETERFVGLRPEQQQIVEEAIDAAILQISRRFTPSHLIRPYTGDPVRLEEPRKPARFSSTLKTSSMNNHAKIGKTMTKHRIYTTSFANVYPLYVAKAERKSRTHTEVDEIIRWLTGYTQEELEVQLEKQTDFETFFADAPALNPLRTLITGVICGVRIDDIEEPTMREIRYLDKLIDELAKGKTMEKILRQP